MSNARTFASRLMAGIGIVALFIAGISLLQQKIDSLKVQNNRQVARRMHAELDRQLESKRKSTLAITLALAEDTGLKDVLKQDDASAKLNAETRHLSKLFRSYTKYKNVWIQIIDRKGTSISRSWTAKRGDSLYNARLDVREMIANPRVMETISTGKFTMSFKSMVPIFDGNKLLGMVEVITHFNSIIKELEKDGTDSMVLVDRRYRKQLVKSISKTFIDGYYVANFDINTQLVDLIKRIGVERLIGIKDYLIYDDNFITLNHIMDIKGDVMGYYLQFRPLSAVENNAVSGFIQKLIFGVLLAVLIILLILAITYNNKRLAEKQKDFFQTVMDSSSDAIIVTDMQHVIDCNQAFQRLFHVIRSNGIDMAFSAITAQIIGVERGAARYSNESWPAYFRRIEDSDASLNFLIEGKPYVLSVHIRSMQDNTGLYLLRFLDITEQQARETRLTKMANHDPLTGLPNRLLLNDRLAQAIAMSNRNGNALAVLMIDLDGFKGVNDSYGHDAGDKLLQVLAERMRLILREGDTVARLGGDEFVAILNELINVDDCVPIINRLNTELARPVHMQDFDVTISASIGIAIYSPYSELTDEEILRHADQAMYHAKVCGRNQYRFYHEIVSQPVTS